MKKQEIRIWEEAQKGEFAFWKFREKQGMILPPASLDRYKKCFKLFSPSINYLTRILDVGSGPHGGIPFFIGVQCFKVSLDPLIGKKGEFLCKEVTREVNSVQAVGEHLPFYAEAFEIVFCINALDHSCKPLWVLNEISRVLKRKKGVLIMMTHVVTSREKTIHSVVHKSGFRRVLFANRITRLCVSNFFRFSFKLIFGFNVADDGILHPFYFTPDDVSVLLSQAGFATRKMRLYPSPWNYKKELFVLAHKRLK